MSAMAGRAARLLHRANPALYPPVQHNWYRLPEDHLRQPSVCAECFEALQPDMDGKVAFSSKQDRVLTLIRSMFE